MTSRSILVRLAVVLLVVGVAGFAWAHASMTGSLREGLEREFDGSVLAKARALGALVEYEGGTFEFDAAADSLPAYSRATDPDVFEIRVAADGRRIARSPALGDASIAVPDGDHVGPRCFDAPAPDGRALRCVRLRVAATLDGPEDDDDAPAAGLVEPPVAASTAGPLVDILVGVGRGEIDARVAAAVGVVRRSLGLLALAMLAAVAAGVHFTRRALHGVTRNLVDTQRTHLGPVEWTPRPPRELLPLTEALDGALEQAGAAVDRERDVLAGIAHELRTPVAEVLATAEIALDQPSAEGLRPALGDVRDVALQMKSTVETMLAVARGRRPAEAAEARDVDLVAMWREASATARPQAAARDIHFETNGAAAAPARCDAAALRIVLGTLAENAARHAPRGSRVRVTAGVGDASWLEVANPAPHLDDDDLPHLTQPLWRKAAANGGPEPGLGLGLYLATEVADHAGVALEITRRGEALVVSVRLPNDR